VRPRVLVLRAIGLGDFLTGVPALRVLRRALPAHEIVLATPAVLGPLVALCEAVDAHLPTGELEPPAWSGPSPEVAVDLHGNGPASKRLLQALHPSRLIAFAGVGGDGRRVPGPAWEADEHETVRWCRLVAESLGERPTPEDLLLPPPQVPSPAPGAVIVHPGAASASRRWPPERFAAVARRLAAAGEDVRVTGSASETGLADRVRRAAGLPPDALLAGRTDLASLAAVVASARLLVAGDTGIAHLATAFGTASVLLFGPTPPHRWGPGRSGPHTVLWHGHGSGNPHGRSLDPALARITVTEVLRAAEDRLGALRSLS